MITAVNPKTRKGAIMRLVVEIELYNAAHVTDSGETHGGEAARVLRNVAKNLEGSLLYEQSSIPLRDVNGNQTGRWAIFER
jgi:hypothetical protein